MNLNKITLILGLAATVGCSTINKEKVTDDLNQRKSKALEALIQISVETRDEMRLIAKSQEAMAMESLTKEQHDQKRYQALKTLSGFEEVVNFNFTGPSTKAAEAIAMMAGYTYKEYGKPLNSFEEPWVIINKKDQPLSESLRELGLQTGKNVRIEVYEPSKLLKYVYLNVK